MGKYLSFKLFCSRLKTGDTIKESLKSTGPGIGGKKVKK